MLVEENRQSLQRVDQFAQLVVGRSIRASVRHRFVGGDETNRGWLGLPGFDTGCLADLVSGCTLDVHANRHGERACRLRRLLGQGRGVGRAAVEDPTAPRLLDILDAVGAEVIPVRCDERGPRPDALADALRRKPVFFIYRPHAHSPAGHSVDAARSAELAAELRRSETLVIEDDGLADLAPGPVQTLGTALPDRVVFVRSYSKSHGPDLRLAVLGGAAPLIERVRVYRTFGSGWTSRILQNCLAHLLTDPHSRALVAQASETYQSRRRMLAEALAARGVRTGGAEGLSLWMPVEDERSALVTLAAHGVAVVPGGRCFSGPHTAFLRVATSRLYEHVDEVADLLAFAAFEEHDSGQPTLIRR